MHKDSIIAWIVYFVVQAIIAWIVLSVVVIWLNPAFYNDDGTLNWWTTLWVAMLIIVFSWIVVVLLGFIIGLLMKWGGWNDGCKKAACEEKVNACDDKYDARSWMY